MKTAKVRIDGQEYMTCLSMRVLEALTDRYGDLSNIAGVMDGENAGQTLRECTWVISVLMQAGARYAELHDLPHSAPPDCDTLMDVLGIDDIGALKLAIMETVMRGSTPDVEVAEPKKD